MRARFDRGSGVVLALATLVLLTTCGETKRSAEASASHTPIAPIESAAPDRIGVELASALPDRWLDAKPELAGHVVLVRWWTDGCPFCERSLPALDALATKHANDGVVAVGVYHPKPPREVSDASVRADAERLGWHGAVAIDADWSALKRAWLTGPEREATSVTFLLDRTGRVRFVHPGPEIHPIADPPRGDEAQHAGCARDYAALEHALEHALEQLHEEKP